ncbi:MAG: hypothetical protein JKY81_02335 [Colwellia sp.]|nr:hypothetical protein [Colwellia sp.]
MSSFQIVQVGDEELEFPSEMSDEDINEVLSKEFGSPATAPPPAPEATPEVIMPTPPPVTPPQESDEPIPVPEISKDGVEGDILSDEGQRTNTEGLDISYLDTNKNPTGGIGHLLTEEEKTKYPEGTVIPRKVVESWFLEDVAEAKVDSQSLIPDAPEEVKEIFTNMAFQLGRDGLKGFDKTIKLIKGERYSEASKEMLKSKWARKDSPARAKRLSNRLLQFAKTDKNLATIERQRSNLKLFSDNPNLTFQEMVDGGVINPDEDN